MRLLVTHVHVSKQELSVCGGDPPLPENMLNIINKIWKNFMKQIFSKLILQKENAINNHSIDTFSMFISLAMVCSVLMHRSETVHALPWRNRRWEIRARRNVRV